MSKPLTVSQLAAHPDLITETFPFRGETITFRLLRCDDEEMLARYFVGLGEETRRRYGPHPFTAEQAAKLCAELNYADTLRFLAVSTRSGAPEIVAYFIVYLGPREGEIKRYSERGITLGSDVCTLAPSVADAYQGLGLGSEVMRRVLDVMRRLGFRRMVLSGGTQATNDRAIHFYEKFGFRRVGDFVTPGPLNNHDMILTL